MFISVNKNDPVQPQKYCQEKCPVTAVQYKIKEIYISRMDWLNDAKLAKMFFQKWDFYAKKE